MLLPKQKESEVVGNVYSDYATRLLQERDQARRWSALWKRKAKDWRATAADMQEAVDVALAEINTSEPYVIRISRREFMELSLETRYKITERQVMDFCALKDV